MAEAPEREATAAEEPPAEEPAAGLDPADEEIPAEGTRERTRLAASAMHRREHQAYGGTIQWDAAFF